MMPPEPTMSKDIDPIVGIFARIAALPRQPTYLGIERELLVSIREAELYNLDFDQVYRDEIKERPGMILEEVDVDTLVGKGECIVLDVHKRRIIRCPRVLRGHVYLPLVDIVGHCENPRDYANYLDQLELRIQQCAENAI